MRLSARGGSRRHVGSAGHSLGFHESPLLTMCGEGLLSNNQLAKRAPFGRGLFLYTKIISILVKTCAIWAFSEASNCLVAEKELSFGQI